MPRMGRVAETCAAIRVLGGPCAGFRVGLPALVASVFPSGFIRPGCIREVVSSDG